MKTRSVRRWCLSLLAASATTASIAGCSSGTTGDAGSDAGDGADAATDDAGIGDAGTDAGADAFTPTAHAAFPALSPQAGPVLASPAIVTVTFADDTNRAALETYGTQMVAETAWWSATTGEYGVGALTHLPDLEIPMSAPRTLDQAGIDALLTSMASAGTLPSRGGSYDGIVYLLYFPHTTVVTLPDVGPSCSGWHGDHGETAIGTSRVSWTATVDCGPNRGFSSLEYIEVGVSHELIETVTDPFPSSAPAYLGDPSMFDPWWVFTELTDRCVGQYVRATDHALAQSWSNAAAVLGGDPCVPAPADTPYYNVTTPMPSVHGAAGTTVDVPLTGWTTAPMPPFLIYAYTAAGFASAPTLDTTHVDDGVTTTMHLRIPAGTPSGSRSWVLVLSGPDDGDARNYPVMLTVD